jgi:Capsule polysaccharide biosynthesis protein
MTRAILTLHAGAASCRVPLDRYLSGADDEAAAGAANTWIKSLRDLRVDQVPLRRRFTHREDSLWWFAELYLHKQQVVLNVFRTIAALDALLAAESPSAIEVTEGDRLVHTIAARFALARGVRMNGSEPRVLPLADLAALDARGSWLQASALGSRVRRPRAEHRTARVLAVVHRAFWRADGDGGAEQYIGPVLRALEARLPAGELQYVSVGPSANFRARRWWHPVVGGSDPEQAPPVESFSGLDSVAPSIGVWRARHGFRRSLWDSHELRRAATIAGCDCWPIIRGELAGIALLQWPWSARAMDEAGAALDALEPEAALTYAEAGGWGRAIVLECRRRGIPSAGLQHGFIYRHWLNYLHEPDEMIADPDHPADAGFPRPSLTLLFDAFAADHLATRGHFPQESLRVTGSPGLDRLVRAASEVSAADLARARAEAGASESDALVVVATKWKEAHRVLPAFLAEADRVPGVRVAIKVHPAETAAAYGEAAAGHPSVRVLDASVPLAPLLAGSRAVVTVNSTVALDAAVLGVPALILGLPNNLSPFVGAGLMADGSEGDPGAALRRILYDEEFRHQLGAARAAFLGRFAIQPDGHAAERNAAAVLELANERRHPAPH